MEENKLMEIQRELMVCNKPSVYLEKIKNSLKDTPLESLWILQLIEQNPRYHPEGNVWNHVMQVIDIAAKIKDFAIDKEAFMLGSLLHDVGKGITTKKNNQGRWTSYNHDVEGVKIAEKILNYYKYDDYEKEKILNLVRFHMHHLYIIKNLPYAKTKEMIKETNLNDIILLFISDRMGRGNFEKHKKENKFFYFMVFIFFCVGIALGTYIVKYMRASDASDLTSYFSTFAQSIVKEPVNNKALLLNVLKKNLILLTVLITISFTVFGTPIILLLDLIKGFTLGYTFSFLISTFEGKGLWLALVATIPQNIIYIPCFIALSIVGIEFSSTKLKDKFFNKGKVNTIVERELIFKIGVFACIFIIGTFIEAYLCPNIIKFVVTNVYKVS